MLKSILIWVPGVLLAILMVGCGQKKGNDVKQELHGFQQGTYGYDVAFLAEQGIAAFELVSRDGLSRVLLSPGYQGRVMTSTSGGSAGQSNGWINYGLISGGEISDQFNPVGGEERFWLGPEGGPYSIYFKPGQEQVYPNWRVPPVIDTEPFETVNHHALSAFFHRSAKLQNASGTEFHLDIDRRVTLLEADTLYHLFGVEFSGDLFKIVAYQTENQITNSGTEAWTREGGLLSVWLLCMFNPSPTTTVFVPFETATDGKVVNDEYFGKVPPDRLIVDQGTVYFRIDGAFRSKIGIPPGRARELCGSYDSGSNLLTLVWGSIPGEGGVYVNSNWGDQTNPYDGDVVNAYNDGPVEDGTIMGPFYEIETSSPGAELQPGESMMHVQRVVHVQGDELELARLVKSLFDLNLYTIRDMFKP